ncbi:uncharacterized protein CXorf65 homolog [Engraulis encrasicolus]|uniref:uncharacterized protein CXorf65 homolog n=1 Tax=Engraulis encrasicolus TaxID=184585 RepID=UPI002FD5BA34
MFVYIKHADSEPFMANTNCPVNLLLQYIRTKMNLPDSDLMDLCDERGILKLLFLQPQDCASRHLASRSTYTVCSINRHVDGSYVSIVPHVVSPDPAILEALQTQTEALEKARLKHLKALEDRKMTGESPSQAQGIQAKGKGKNADPLDDEHHKRAGRRRN